MPRRIYTYLFPDGSIKLETCDFKGQECEKAREAFEQHLRNNGLQLEETEKHAKIEGIQVKVTAEKLLNTSQ